MSSVCVFSSKGQHGPPNEPKKTNILVVTSFTCCRSYQHAVNYWLTCESIMQNGTLPHAITWMHSCLWDDVAIIASYRIFQSVFFVFHSKPSDNFLLCECRETKGSPLTRVRTKLHEHKQV